MMARWATTLIWVTHAWPVRHVQAMVSATHAWTALTVMMVLAGLLTVGPVMALGSVQALARLLAMEPLMALAAKSPASSPFQRLCVPCVQR